MGTKASIARKGDTKRRDSAPNPFFLISEDARKSFGHTLGMLWLRDIEAKKVQVAQ